MENKNKEYKEKIKLTENKPLTNFQLQEAILIAQNERKRYEDLKYTNYPKKLRPE